MIDHNELLPEGRELGGFRIEKAIGHGNMGIIYRAIQVNLNRPVALKVLFKAVANDQDFVRSFFREAQAAAAFTHQNIVQAFDVGQSDDGVYYFAMELIDGGDISLQLKMRGMYEPVEALEKMLGIADGLDYGSTLRKLTHGDIKPANIMITRAGRFKLADLGLARMGGEIQGESDGIMLTPLYAAPEMINGSWSVGDPRADMYSLGATLYHMMSGHPPFYDDDYEKVIQMQLSHQHTSLKDAIDNFPANISRLVDRFLEKDPDDRFETWGEAKHAMEITLKDPHASHTKKKKKVIHLHHQKDDDEDQDSSHSGSHRSQSTKKKKSQAPVIISIITLLVVAGLGFFALNMKKDVVGKDYRQLTTRFEGKKPEAIIQMIQKFVKRHGATPPEAEADLVKYNQMLQDRSLFSVNDLTYQTKKIEDFEEQYSKKNPVITENFRFNTSRIESDLNANLDNNSLIFHLPLNETLHNHASFYSPPRISVNNGEIGYTTAQVDKGIEFSGQSIVYGDVSILRFSSKSSFTLSFWINPKSTDSPILGKCESSGGIISRGYLISLVGGKLQADLFENSDTSKLTVKTTKELSLSNWNHVVFEYDGQGASIFLNGAKAEAETISSTLKEDFSSTGPFIVGFSQLSAVLDDVRIWSRTLTEKELKELNSFRSITDLEKLTGRYQNIKEKIKKADFNLNTSPDKNDPDIGPPNNDGIRHPEYKFYLESLKRLKNNPGKWKSESQSTSKLSKMIARDVPEHEKRMSIISKHIEDAYDRFFSLLQKCKDLKGKKIPAGKCKGYEFISFENNVIQLKEDARIGKIIHQYHTLSTQSSDAVNGVIALMLEEELFKDATPEIFIYAMIMGHDVNYSGLVKNGSFPEIIKGLKEDLDRR